MYVGMIETRSLKILLKSFRENYSDLLKKQHGRCYEISEQWFFRKLWVIDFLKLVAALALICLKMNFNKTMEVKQCQGISSFDWNN